jgi:site-specific DNA-methyltransferase (adenine-specific)
MNNIELIKGDCLKVMDSLIEKGIKIDCMLTDPPYGMAFQSNYRKEKYNNIKGDSNLEWLDDFASKSYELAKDNTAHYVFCSFHHIDKFKQAFEKYFKVKNILVWEKIILQWVI